jgi:hypothetical protein
MKQEVKDERDTLREENRYLKERLREFDGFIQYSLLSGQLENFNTPLDDYNKRVVRAVYDRFIGLFPECNDTNVIAPGPPFPWLRGLVSTSAIHDIWRDTYAVLSPLYGEEKAKTVADWIENKLGHKPATAAP